MALLAAGASSGAKSKTLKNCINNQGNTQLVRFLSGLLEIVKTEMSGFKNPHRILILCGFFVFGWHNLTNNYTLIQPLKGSIEGASL
jgi:hypothetical protein